MVSSNEASLDANENSPMSEMLNRFVGPEGRQSLVDALRSQPIIGGNPLLGEKVADLATVIAFSAGSTIIEEASSENDLFFILSGTVTIRVQGRELALRTAGQQVGEMAIVDPGQPRSASVIADGDVVIAKLSAANFLGLAERYPIIWRNVSGILAERLRQRNRFVTPLNSLPVLFIGCSSEALPIGRSIQSELDHDLIVVKLWANDIFKASEFTIESLERELPKIDFAVLLLSPDDIVVSREVKGEAPRDNIVLELGLFVGALGRKRTFLLCPQGAEIKIPSDLLGITALRYRREPEFGNTAAVAAACNELRNLISEIGPK